MLFRSLLAEKLELPENDVRKIIAKSEATDNNIQVGSYDDRRTTAQKYIIATFFSNFGVSVAYDVMHKKLKIYTKLESNFRKIYDKIINTILLYGSNSDIINIVHSLDVMTQDELHILDDAYFKKDDFDYLEDERELELFLQDQIENLK